MITMVALLLLLRQPWPSLRGMQQLKAQAGKKATEGVEMIGTAALFIQHHFKLALTHILK